jgi:hypothetical protein
MQEFVDKLAVKRHHKRLRLRTVDRFIIGTICDDILWTRKFYSKQFTLPHVRPSTSPTLPSPLPPSPPASLSLSHTHTHTLVPLRSVRLHLTYLPPPAGPPPLPSLPDAVRSSDRVRCGGGAQGGLTWGSMEAGVAPDSKILVTTRSRKYRTIA